MFRKTSFNSPKCQLAAYSHLNFWLTFDDFKYEYLKASRASKSRASKSQHPFTFEDDNLSFTASINVIIKLVTKPDTPYIQLKHANY